MHQLRISLDDELRAVLEEAAAKAGHSLSEEIRRRAALTTYRDLRQSRRVDFDAWTIDLAEDVMQIARIIAEEAESPGRGEPKPPSWHVLPQARRALLAALKEWLATTGPGLKDTSAAVADLFGPTDPQAVGKAAAQAHGRAKEMDPAAKEMDPEAEAIGQAAALTHRRVKEISDKGFNKGIQDLRRRNKWVMGSRTARRKAQPKE